MKLNECSFYRSGRDMNFSVFSDDVCRVHHMRSIALPLGGDIDVYDIEPGQKSHWIVVRQTEDGRHDLRWFVRRGSEFHEHRENVSQALKSEVGEKFPQLLPKAPPMVA